MNLLALYHEMHQNKRNSKFYSLKLLRNLTKESLNSTDPTICPSNLSQQLCFLLEWTRRTVWSITKMVWLYLSHYYNKVNQSVRSEWRLNGLTSSWSTNVWQCLIYLLRYRFSCPVATRSTWWTFSVSSAQSISKIWMET